MSDQLSWYCSASVQVTLILLKIALEDKNSDASYLDMLKRSHKLLSLSEKMKAHHRHVSKEKKKHTQDLILFMVSSIWWEYWNVSTMEKQSSQVPTMY